METLSRNGLRRPFCNSLKKKAFVKGLSVFDVFREVFKNGLSNIFGRQPLKSLKGSMVLLK